MARFHGKIGFELDQVEREPGVYEPSRIVEKPYTGDLPKYLRRWEPVPDSANDNLVLANRVSIICDEYMEKHWPTIKYAVFDGVKWKVESAEIKRPRIFLTLGGVWNGHTA